MRKLLTGIVEFRKKVRPSVKETFARLALGQKPDALLIACSDSRVVPNLFASTDPGDLFVVRNVGNLVPPAGKSGHSVSDESEVAAIEFAIQTLGVSHIIVCGHSECGAMCALADGRSRVRAPHLKSWLRYGEPAVDRLEQSSWVDQNLSLHNQISQQNVLVQLEHLESYPEVHKRLESGSLQLHGWWFDIAEANVYSFDSDLSKFVLLDETVAQRLLEKIDSAPQKKTKSIAHAK